MALVFSCSVSSKNLHFSIVLILVMNPDQLPISVAYVNTIHPILFLSVEFAVPNDYIVKKECGWWLVGYLVVG